MLINLFSTKNVKLYGLYNLILHIYFYNRNKLNKKSNFKFINFLCYFIFYIICLMIVLFSRFVFSFLIDEIVTIEVAKDIILFYGMNFLFVIFSIFIIKSMVIYKNKTQIKLTKMEKFNIKLKIDLLKKKLDYRDSILYINLYYSINLSEYNDFVESFNKNLKKSIIDIDLEKIKKERDLKKQTNELNNYLKKYGNLKYN